ncbi:energy transducer TonB [Seleniivibrio woodruffii]|uniref:energy transducer TonB n=1 Tax=Seleniivibrio woodruffii TaxID=1078050 RepID=UPI0026ED6F8F|nr:energy transducer TonB [Seleniivibrio woodruffii]
MRKATVQSLAIHGLLLGALFYASTITGLGPKPETQVIDLSAYFKELAPPPSVEQPLAPATSPEPVQQQKAEAPAPVPPKPVQKQVTAQKPVENKIFESVNSAAVAEIAAPAAPAPIAAEPVKSAPVAAAAPAVQSAPPSSSAPVASARPEFDYSAYQSTLNSRLEKNKYYPMMARRRGMEGTVKMKLVIAPNGSLVESQVVASSGYDILDGEALKLVRSVFPIKHNSDKQISVVVPVTYKLQG